MLPLLGGLISAGTSLLGGKMASDATQEANARAQAAQEQANRTAIALRDQDHERQERFARSGIQWRAEDAAKAGIHPLYALGANVSTYSPSPVSIGTAPVAADTAMGTALAQTGQDISRAISATRTDSQRADAYTKTVQDLSLTKMGLENELLASQIKRLQVNDNPPFPSGIDSRNNPTTALEMPPNWRIPKDKVDPQPRIIIGGREFDLDPRTTNAEGVETALGDDTPLSWGVNTIAGMRHLKHHLEKNTSVRYSKPTSWRDYLPSISLTR